MAVEVSDAISQDGLEAAAQLTCDLARDQPCAPLDAHVERAVRRTFCACVVDIEDAIEGGVSGMHTALLDAVGRRARQLLGRETGPPASGDEGAPARTSRATSGPGPGRQPGGARPGSRLG